MNLKKFTLLELLLVIAIILILLSLIIPGIIKAQRQAELVVCTNNLRGIGTAVALYHKDNKRYFPDAEGDDYLTSQEEQRQEEPLPGTYTGFSKAQAGGASCWGMKEALDGGGCSPGSTDRPSHEIPESSCYQGNIQVPPG